MPGESTKFHLIGNKVDAGQSTASDHWEFKTAREALAAAEKMIRTGKRVSGAKRDTRWFTG